MKLGGFRSLQWAFPLAVTLHHGEEAFFMPGWVSAHTAQLPLHPGPGVIRVGLLSLAMAAFAVTLLSAKHGAQSVWAYLLFGGAATMLLNVFVPHIPAALVTRQYTPGLVTAVLVNLPVMSTLMYLALHERWVSGMRAARYALLVPLAIAASILGLFTLA